MRLDLRQPPSSLRVREYVIAAPLSWRTSRAVTLAIGRWAWIVYWTPGGFPPPADLRVHEWTHIAQVERVGWLRHVWRYLLGLRHGYRANPLEREAYNAQAHAVLTGMPDWTRITPRS